MFSTYTLNQVVSFTYICQTTRYLSLVKKKKKKNLNLQKIQKNTILEKKVTWFYIYYITLFILVSDWAQWLQNKKESTTEEQSWKMTFWKFLIRSDKTRTVCGEGKETFVTISISNKSRVLDLHLPWNQITPTEVSDLSPAAHS